MNPNLSVIYPPFCLLPWNVNCSVMVRRLGGYGLKLLLSSPKGARHVGKTGRRWSFLLAFEEVQDERGLGTASSGYNRGHTLCLCQLFQDCSFLKERSTASTNGVKWLLSVSSFYRGKNDSNKPNTGWERGSKALIHLSKLPLKINSLAVPKQEEEWLWFLLSMCHYITVQITVLLHV